MKNVLSNRFGNEKVECIQQAGRRRVKRIVNRLWVSFARKFVRVRSAGKVDCRQVSQEAGVLRRRFWSICALLSRLNDGRSCASRHHDDSLVIALHH